MRSIRIDYTEDRKFGFVEFAEASSASKLLLKRQLKIVHEIIEIQAVDINYSINDHNISPNIGPNINPNIGAFAKLRRTLSTLPRFSRKRLKEFFKLKSTIQSSPNNCSVDDPVLMESSNDESSNSENILNVLSDDCLREIFKRLDLLSITNAADVCVRFKENAKQVAKQKLQSHEKYVSLYYWQLCGFAFEHVEKFFRNFGSMIQSFRVNVKLENFDGYPNHSDRSTTIFSLLNE